MKFLSPVMVSVPDLCTTSVSSGIPCMSAAVKVTAPEELGVLVLID